MIKLFKGLTLLYIAAVVGGAVAIGLLCEFLRLDSGYIFAFGFVWILFIGIVFIKNANARYRKIMEYMNNCQCRRFIEETLKLSKSKRQVNEIVSLNLSSAYINIGDFDKAMETLKTVPITFSKRPAQMVNEFIYFNNLFAAYCSDGDIEKAEAALKSMKIYIDAAELTEPHRSMCIKPYIDKQYKLNIEKGNFDGALEHFTNMYNTENTLIGKVNYSYNLGLVYEHNGDTEKAKEYFEFAAEKGGDTAVVGKAKEKLSKI